MFGEPEEPHALHVIYETEAMDQVLKTSQAPRRDTLIRNVHGTHCIRGVHNKAIITRGGATGPHMYVTERTN
jgi:hypothetical protein